MTHSTDRTSSATSPRAAPHAREVDPAVVAWVVDSCARQGVPVKVTDAAVVARIGVLLAGSVPGDGPDCRLVGVVGAFDGEVDDHAAARSA